ncbi:MAG: histidine kinase [Ginsengibacter sp.]
MLKVLFILLFISTLTDVNAQSTLTLNGQPDWKNAFDLAPYTYSYQELSNSPLLFSEIKQKQFLPFKENDYRYAKSPRIVQWLKFTLSNESKTDTIHLILNLDAHYLLQLYTGDSLISTRGTEIKTNEANRFGLPFILSPSETHTYYAKMEERIRYLTPFFVRLETPESYFSQLSTGFFQERWLRFVLPLMAGMLLLISMFGLFQYYLLRDKAFIYYFIYAFAAFLLSFYWMEDRIYLSFLSPAMRRISDSFLMAIVLAGYVFFVDGVLHLAKHFPKLWKLLKLLLLIVAIQAIISFIEFVNNHFLFDSDAYYTYLQGIPFIVITIVLLIATIKSSNPVKRFIAAGLSSLMLFFFFPSWGFFFNYFHHLPHSIASIVDYGPFFFMFGITIEAVCFAFALAYRTRLVTEEKNNLQLEYATQLEDELKTRTTELHKQNELIEAQKIKQLQTEFEHKISETEMTALRAQMNPHFIFNCLNSIKLYTLENDSATASEYLTKFSQLIRLVLENSRSEKVTLEKELQTLTLYIEMEAMRFKNKVRYAIEVENDIDVSYIEIPPLLIQPYVENAIWHGLMQKKEGGFIRIHISMAGYNLLHIEISDNGVGRKLAQEYKSKSVTTKKSFGLKMTSERMQLINQVYQTNTSVEIIDETDEQNNPLGTKVIIEIPL